MTAGRLEAKGFPDGFRWGVATSSYQIEGAVAEGGRGPSIWDDFTHKPGTISDGSTGDVACDHYHRYRDDVALMAGLGVQDYRFSVSWSRVQPIGIGAVNQEGLGFYQRLVDALLEDGIRPVLTLFHWDLPSALQTDGGWANRDTAARFADYATVVAGALGDRVPVFTTLNEPWCSAFLGHGTGDHAPGIRDNGIAFAAAHHLLLAHGLATAALRSALPSGSEVWLTVNPAYTRPASQTEVDVRAARDAELAQNQVFLDPVLRGELNAELVERTTAITDWSFVADGDLAIIGQPIDALGVNYYKPHLVTGVPVPGVDPWPGLATCWEAPAPPPVTGMGWAVRPETFTDMLCRLARDYPGVPMAVTENGSAYPDEAPASDSGGGAVEHPPVDDPNRRAYLLAHLAAVRHAIDAGVDVRGYYAWSLLDNFEWAWGYTQRFGLVYVDFDTQQRTLKSSALAYQQVIAEHVAARR